LLPVLTTHYVSMHLAWSQSICSLGKSESRISYDFVWRKALVQNTDSVAKMFFPQPVWEHGNAEGVEGVEGVEVFTEAS
jgi:hypothetical protein